MVPVSIKTFFVYFGHSFAYVANLRFLGMPEFRTESSAVASGRATNLATHPPFS
jgi:hypothetical protein